MRPKKKSKRAEPASGGFPAVGHDPSSALPAGSERLLRAVQSNFLSLLSHELKTPLMGVLNALTLLEEGAGSDRASGLSSRELLSTARRSAEALHGALTTLLDLAALESGNLRLQWKEIDLPRLAQALARGLKGARFVRAKERPTRAPVLGDAAKLVRALERIALSLRVLMKRGSAFRVEAGERKVALLFTLDRAKAKEWEAFRVALTAAHDGGVFSPSSAFSSSFGQLLQEETAFLSNDAGALAGELFLAEEIVRLHGASLKTSGKSGGSARVEIALPGLSPEEGLRQAIRARLADVRLEGGGVSLCLLRFDGAAASKAERRARELEACVYRGSDAAYALGGGTYALLLADWVPEAGADLLGRIRAKIREPFQAAWAHAPRDGVDPDLLVRRAMGALGSVRNRSGNRPRARS